MEKSRAESVDGVARSLQGINPSAISIHICYKAPPSEN